ncbi:MAG: hypothetical protein ACI8UO_003624 [Verrucomicrobiales bacterium]|jgi:hypothetical protein
MKSLVSIVVLFLATSAAAEQLTDNKFFEALKGKWTGRGDFTGTDDGAEPTLARNTIEAAFSDDGQMFTIKGGLLVGEDGTAFAEQPFLYRWEIMRSSIEGLYAGRFIVLTGDGEESDYEVSIDESALTAKLVQISGASGGSRFELTQQIVGDKYVVKISQIDSNGKETTKGELTFTRED